MLLRTTWTILTLLLATGAQAEAPYPTKIYTDQTSGLTLAYPSNWTLKYNTSDLGPSLLFGAGDHSQASQITLLAAEKTYITAPRNGYSAHMVGTFLFHALPNVSEEKCYASISSLGDDQRRPAWTTLHGTRFLKLETTYGAAGTADEHTLYATFRSGECYLLEILILSSYTDAELPPGFKPDPPKLLLDLMDQIMQSVRIPPAQPQK
jgi:hypothetical protein